MTIARKASLVTLIAVSAILLIMLGGCTKSSSDGGSDDSTDTGDVNAGPASSASEFTTSCGVVLGGLIKNPVTPAEGEFFSTVRALGSNLLSVNGANGAILIKLHAIGQSSRFQSSGAKNLLDDLASGGAYFFKATTDCTVTTSGGGVGTSGQLFTPNGKSFSEELITAGLAGDFDSSGSCGEGLIASCYAALKASSTPDSAGEITDFLWKPEADSDYNKGKLIIHADPCDTRVVVNGEELGQFGAGNGRCTTARSLTKSGCAFGANIKVEIFDEATGAPYLFPGGQPYIIIPNGCDRVEVKI